MIRCNSHGWASVLALGLLLAAPGAGAEGAQRAPNASKRAKPQSKAAAPAVEPRLEPKAIELLKAASDRLAAARSMRFTAVISYESPSRHGPPLIYTTKSDVVVQRPDKLRVITSGDGPPSEFYYDGKTMVAFAPAENLIAVAEAPPTIDAALKAAYDSAAIYFPFTDLIVADPYADMAEGLRLAFYVGQSQIVGGTTTDIVVYASYPVFVQIWIGAEDKLPRMVRATYRDDPARLRHQMELSNWWLDLDIPPDAFAPSNAAGAKRIEFAHPGRKLPPGASPPGQSAAPKSQ